MSTTDDQRRKAGGGVTPDGGDADATFSAATYDEVAATPEFQALRRSFRSFVLPMTAVFLLWYFVYVLLADYATGFMSTPVFGNINVGLLLGLGQFASTFIITSIYARWADRKFDPVATQLRERIEGSAR